MSLVTVDQVTDLGLAEMVRMKLDAVGIPVHLQGHGFASLFATGTSVSAIRVQVPAEHAQDARRVLAELYCDLAADERPSAE